MGRDAARYMYEYVYVKSCMWAKSESDITYMGISCSHCIRPGNVVIERYMFHLEYFCLMPGIGLKMLLKFKGIKV